MKKTRRDKLYSFLFIGAVAILATPAWADQATTANRKVKLKQNQAKNVDQLQTSQSSVAAESTANVQDLTGKKKSSRFGMNYFSFVSGPGLDPDRRDYPPNELGRPDFTGMNSFNVISLRYKMTDKVALDFQTRTRIVFNNGVESKNFNSFIWEAPRIGISGRLAGGDEWALTGAVNTDFPSFLPSPLTGYTARERTVMFNPGLFANFRYTPKKSKWSLFAILTPRYFFYSDREALEPEARNAGASGKNKTELGLWMSPTVNYSFTEKSALTFGTSLGYIKQVGSSWNPLNATAVGNSTSDEWVFEALPISVGWTYTVNELLTVYPFIQAFPIAKQRVDAGTGRKASFLETASIGMWVSGTLF